MTSYSFSPINWGGQGRSPTTGHIQADAGSGRRTEAKRKRAGAGSAQPQPLMGHTTSSLDFESVNNFVAGLQSGDDVAMAAVTVYGASVVSRAVATGRLAQGRRR